jgi:hypothetical protein
VSGATNTLAAIALSAPSVPTIVAMRRAADRRLIQAGFLILTTIGGQTINLE